MSTGQECRELRPGLWQVGATIVALEEDGWWECGEHADFMDTEAPCIHVQAVPQGPHTTCQWVPEIELGAPCDLIACGTFRILAAPDEAAAQVPLCPDHARRLKENQNG